MTDADESVSREMEQEMHAAERSLARASGKAEFPMLGAAVVVLKVLAALFLLVSSYVAIATYTEADMKHRSYESEMRQLEQRSRQSTDLLTATYPTYAAEASTTGLLAGLGQALLVSFLIYVSGDVIRLQLAIKRDIATLLNAS